MPARGTCVMALSLQKDHGMLMPTIDRYMTRQPWTIRRTASIAAAHSMMREHEVRHLPVLDAGRLVGIVSDRDIHLIGHLLGESPGELTVEEAMTQDVYGVSADAPADEVLEHMAERKLGSCVVLDRRGWVAGIFTTVDALQRFADLLKRDAA